MEARDPASQTVYRAMEFVYNHTAFRSASCLSSFAQHMDEKHPTWSESLFFIKFLTLPDILDEIYYLMTLWQIFSSSLWLDVSLRVEVIISPSQFLDRKCTLTITLWCNFPHYALLHTVLILILHQWASHQASTPPAEASRCSSLWCLRAPERTRGAEAMSHNNCACGRLLRANQETSCIYFW